MQIEPQINAVSIAALGNFNPLIFRTDWFKAKEIVVGADFDNAKIDILHADVSSFRLPWGQMQVDRDRFQISATKEPLIRVNDFFVKTFQFLPETPIRAFGINREFHFDAGTAGAWESIGDIVAPKQFWSDFVRAEDGTKVGGMRMLIMEQAISVRGRSARLDGLYGWIRVHIEPSVRVVPNGVFVLVNDHFDLMEGDRPADGRKAVELVLEKWDTSLDRAEALVDRIMGLAIDS
jgi:hypothetical protein